MATCPTCGRMIRTVAMVYRPVRDAHRVAFSDARLLLAHAGERDDLAVTMARALVAIDDAMRAAIGEV